VNYLAARIGLGSRSQAVALVAQPLKPGVHSTEQKFRCGSVDIGRPQGSDVALLTLDLPSHMPDYV